MPIGRARVFLQVVEEGRLVARLHAFEDREVQLERLLDRVEDAPDPVRRRVAGELLHVAVGEQVDVEFRPDPLQRAREAQRRHIRSFRLAERIKHRAQHRRVVARAIGEALGENDRDDVGIDRRGAERVLEGADEDRLVDERIFRPA